MFFLRKLVVCFVILALCSTLVGCGKVSSPVPLEGSGYPHSYPRH